MDCNMPGSSVFQRLLKFMSIELEMLPNHLILCHPILIWWLPSCQASGSFPMSQLFTSSWKYSSAYPPRAWDWEKGIKLELIAWKMVDFMDWSLLLFPCLCSPDSHYEPGCLTSWCSSPVQSDASNAPPLLFYLTNSNVPWRLRLPENWTSKLSSAFSGQVKCFGLHEAMVPSSHRQYHTQLAALMIWLHILLLHRWGAFGNQGMCIFVSPVSN